MGEAMDQALDGWLWVIFLAAIGGLVWVWLHAVCTAYDTDGE